MGDRDVERTSLEQSHHQHSLWPVCFASRTRDPGSTLDRSGSIDAGGWSDLFRGAHAATRRGTPRGWTGCHWYDADGSRPTIRRRAGFRPKRAPSSRAESLSVASTLAINSASNARWAAIQPDHNYMSGRFVVTRPERER